MKSWRHLLLVIAMAALGGGFPLLATPQDATFSHEFNPPPLPQTPGEMGERLTPLGAPEVLSEDTDTPDITIFDIFVGGVQHGSAMANYTNHWVEIEHPEGLLSQLPETKHPAQLVKLLTGQLTEGKELPNVGKITIRPEKFRLDITLAPDMLFLASLGPNDDLPPPKKELVLSQSFLLNASTNTDSSFGKDKLGLRHRGAISFGATRLVTEGTLEEQDYTLTNLALNHDAGEINYSVGFLETSGQSLAVSQEYLGARISTISELRVQDENRQASALVIFIPTRAKVEIFRDGQLLFSRLLDFGLQEIDTSRFPSGSYQVEVVITDDAGNVSRSSQFYTKTTQLVPRGKPYISGSLGLMREDAFNLEDTFIAQAETRVRLNGIMEAGLSAYATDEVISSEASINGLWRNVFFSTGYSHTSQNDAGFRASASYVGTNLGLSLNYLKTLQGYDDRPTLEKADNILAKAREQFSADITYNFGPLTTGLKATRSAALDEVTRYSWGPQLAYEIYRDGSHRLGFKAEYFQTSDGPQSTALLNYSWVPYQSKWSANASLSQRRQNNQQQTLTTTSLNYDSGFGTNTHTTAQLVNETGQDANTSLQASYENTTAKFSGFARNSHQTGNTALGIEAQTTFIAFADGYTHAAAEMDSAAGLLTTFTGNAKGTLMDVFINDNLRATTKVGDTATIGLEPYKTYKVSVTPNDPENMVEFDTKPRFITVYPGNMQHQSYDISQALLLFGRIITPENLPMSQVKITGGKHPVYTDEFGFFELETTGKEAYAVTISDNKTCQVQLPPLAFDRQFYNIGDAICQ